MNFSDAGPPSGSGPQAEARPSFKGFKEKGADLIYIRSRTLGEPDTDLGEVLMKSFYQSACELSSLPGKIVLMHGGVKHAASGSPFLYFLKRLEARGVKIMVSAACLDYYEIKSKLKAGKISSMAEIVSALNSSSSTLTL